MKKIHARVPVSLTWLIMFLLVLMALSSGCNLPQKETASTNEIIASIVAQTLTAQPVVKTSAKETSVPVTITPSAMIIITLPLTETPTTTLTPEEDFKATLGNPTVKDTLENGKGFGLSGSGYSDDAASINVSSGVMSLQSFSTLGWRTWRVRPPQTADFYLEGKFITQNCADKDQFGLVFRSPNYESGYGYYYGFRCNGSLSLARWDDNETTYLLNDTLSPYSLTGSGQTNHLGVLARGNHLKLFINDKPVQELDDSSFSNGFFGVFIAGYSGNLTVQLDEITLWKQ